MAKKQRKNIKNIKAKKPKATPKKAKKSKWLLAVVAILILAIAGIIAFGLIGDNSSSRSKKHHKRIEAAGNKSIHSCKRTPAFALKYGLKYNIAIDLRQGNEFRGLRLIDIKTGKSLRLPGWDSFGYLGLYTLDDKGNIYTSPVPYVSIDINPPKEQNKILIVDSKTGKMSEFMRLPSDNPPSPRNPFGVIGLAFDCETKSLYASSVAGSSFKNESGKVFQIDPQHKKILSTFDNHDVLGLAIFRGKSGKRMYMGMARKPEVYSVGLKDDGSFDDDFRYEFSLKDVPGGANLKAHRIKIKNGIMTLKAREFSYSLIAASNPMRTIYTFKYSPEKDKWEFVSLRAE